MRGSVAKSSFSLADLLDNISGEDFIPSSGQTQLLISFVRVCKCFIFVPELEISCWCVYPQINKGREAETLCVCVCHCTYRHRQLEAPPVRSMCRAKDSSCWRVPEREMFISSSRCTGELRNKELKHWTTGFIWFSSCLFLFSLSRWDRCVDDSHQH